MMQKEVREGGLNRNKEEKGEEMLPRPGGVRTDSSTGGSGGRNFSGVQFLKVEHLSPTFRPAKILGVREKVTKYQDVELKITIGGSTYFWGLKATGNAAYTKNFADLYNKFGSDENDWVGKTFFIGLEYDDYTERSYPAVKFELKANDDATPKTRKK
jgi:hypothetical protein